MPPYRQQTQGGGTAAQAPARSVPRAACRAPQHHAPPPECYRRSTARRCPPSWVTVANLSPPGGRNHAWGPAWGAKRHCTGAVRNGSASAPPRPPQPRLGAHALREGPGEFQGRPTTRHRVARLGNAVGRWRVWSVAGAVLRVKMTAFYPAFYPAGVKS